MWKLHRWRHNDIVTSWPHTYTVYASVGKTCCNNACTHVIKRWHTENNWSHSEIHLPSCPLGTDLIILTNGTRGFYQIILTSTTCYIIPAIPSCFLAFFSDPYSLFEIFIFYHSSLCMCFFLNPWISWHGAT